MSGPEITLVEDAPLEIPLAPAPVARPARGRADHRRGRVFWALVAVAVGVPRSPLSLFGDYSIGDTAYSLVWTFMAMGLCVVWATAGR